MVRCNVRTGLMVMALLIGGTTADAGATTIQVASDRSAPQAVGTVIRWTTTTGGGTAPYSFKWWLYDGSTWRLLRDWHTSPTYDWSPVSANSAYRIGVWVRSAGKTADKDEANAAAYFAIAPAPPPSARASGITLAPDRGAPQAPGTTVTWTAQATGGAAPHSYKWWLFDGATWQLLRDWGAGTLAWTPVAANAAYRIGVWARSAGSTLDADEVNDAAYFAIAAPAPAPPAAGTGQQSGPATSVVLTADSAAPQPAGSTIRWTATAAGGVAPLSYKWWVWDGVVWSLLSDWSVNNEVAWTPPAPNEAYRIGVWVRSANNPQDDDETNGSQYFPVRGGVADCIDAVEPAVVGVGSGGGTASTRVVVGQACAWQARSQANWISIVAPASGTADGTLTLQIAPNIETVSRTGTVTVGARVVSIAQGGAASPAGCSYGVFPTSLSVGSGNETAEVAVTAPEGCTWNVTGGGFAQASRSGGTGAGTLIVAVENNTATESRATVLTVAGRAVTVTQAGRVASSPNCTYTVTPQAASFDFRAASGTVSVSAPSGCAWSASESSSFVHFTGATSGTGSGSVAYALEANGATTSRSAALMVAGRAVTLSQSFASAAPACVYRLSTASAVVSYAGGSGAFAVETAAGCEWEVVSHTDWLHVTETSASAGNGSVWFSVDGNAASERAGTLVVAGQVFTVSQGSAPVSASAGDITWITPPDDKRVGDCDGNCGAGCSTFFNPCGGPHYWEREVLTAPQYVGDDWEPVCGDSSSWFVVRPRFTALVRWTYHGLKSSNCQAHDATCRALDLIPFIPADKVLCLATAGLVGLNGFNYCDDARPFDWSYEFVDVGHGAPVAYIDGAGSCH